MAILTPRMLQVHHMMTAIGNGCFLRLLSCGNQKDLPIGTIMGLLRVPVAEHAFQDSDGLI